MKKIKNSIKFGNNILENTKKEYLEKYEELESKKIIDILSDKDTTTRLENKIESYKSYIDYLNFIQNELNKIHYFIETECKIDFQYECMFFGNETFYYTNKLLDYNEQEIFEIILNHIIHYTGCFYIISSKNVRLSYSLSAISICYNEKIDLKDGKDIYINNKDNFDHIIFDISNTYQKFVLRNKHLLNSLFKNINDEIDYNNLLTYRIMLGNKIKLENMIIGIKDETIDFVNKYHLEESEELEDDRIFKLA